MNFSVHQVSHIGNRKFNQDRVAYAYSNDVLLLVLADGMGGHLHGELASRMVIETFVDSFGPYAQSFPVDPRLFLENTMRRANQRILQVPHASAAGSAPGSTCVAALIQDGKVHWGHAGDSRFYLLRDGAVLAVTRDHSIVQQWVDWGMISVEEARLNSQRNKITNCLGGAKNLFYMEAGEPVELRQDDVLLLGSDGLWGPFTDNELAEKFVATPVAEALNNLAACALDREEGNSDNITGIALRWGAREAAHDTAEPVSCILEIH
ncbi:MAG: protein phosphatase 2C domain-containing protein [Gallionellaceae bacterium]|jgi:serine/threonine protein phosphatase PrpC|nr:protein phosphatase 2C domain-containing protein [Gallionellaceae bacterium]